MNKIILFTLLTLLYSCSRKIQLKQSCDYAKINYNDKNVNIDSLFSHYLNKYHLKYNKTEPDFITLYYQSKESSLSSDYWLTILAYISKDSCVIFCTREDPKLNTNLVVYKEDNNSYKNLKEYVNTLPNEFMERDCVVGSGVESIFLIEKNNKPYNYLKSYGYDCWIADSTLITHNYTKIFLKINELINFSKFKK